VHGVIARDGALVFVERPDEPPGPGRVRIAVAACGVNRADLAQRAGRYPPPPGASDVLGLEVAGTIDAVGEGVVGHAVGDRVAALLSGGGYATSVVCPASALLPVPADLPLVEAAALPEALCTARMCLEVVDLRAGDVVVWHAGASGVGSVALQVLRELGLRGFATVGTADKLVRCRALGAEAGWVRSPDGFVAAVRDFAPSGAALIVDPVGGPYLRWDQEVLAAGGTIVVLSFLAGRDAPLDLGRLLVKGQTVRGLTLRSRAEADKARLVTAVRDRWWPWVADGRVGAVIDEVLPLASAHVAHARLASDATVGKLVLTP
jgi:putative PIG3 family NAD(P)H quinone oxidoreductase